MDDLLGYDIENYSVEPGKYLDVPFVPTDEETVEAMLSLAKVGPRDVLYDLGSGDGRIVIAAAKDRNTRGIGIEIDPVQIADAMEQAGWAGVEYLVDFVEGDFFTADFSEATVVSLYLLDSINVQLRHRLLSELRPGTRIVSHAFDMGDWRADDRIKMSGTTIYKWIVPARVAGAWKWEGSDGKPYHIKLQQKYQDVTGRGWCGDEEVQLEDIELCGSRLELTVRKRDSTAENRFSLDFEDEHLKRASDEQDDS